jgi:hypothetical protein
VAELVAPGWTRCTVSSFFEANGRFHTINRVSVTLLDEVGCNVNGDVGEGG